MFFKYLFKACVAVFLLSNTFVIVNGVFEMPNVLVQGVVTTFADTQAELGGYDMTLYNAMVNNTDMLYCKGYLRYNTTTI
jgi:hypothetical protein